jgi:hypothetical protein
MMKNEMAGEVRERRDPVKLLAFTGGRARCCLVKLACSQTVGSSRV